jgi:Zn-dependent protease
MKFIDSGVIPYNPYFYTFFYMLMIYNVCFAAFNILPFPPLDGSKVIAAIIPDEWSEFLYGNRQLFMLILVVLMTTGYVTKFMQPVVGWLYYFIDLLVF